MLREYALAIIREHPWAFADLVLRDLTAPFTPGARGVDVSVRLPEGGSGGAPLPCEECDGVDVEPVNEAVRDEYEPGYEPRVRWPSGALLAYQDWLHTPRWLMGALALLVAAATLLCVTPLRRRLERRRETFLLGGMAIAILLGSAATVNPLVRFLVPLVPLLLCGGIAAALDLLSLRAGRPSASGAALPPRQLRAAVLQAEVRRTYPSSSQCATGQGASKTPPSPAP